MQLQLVEDVVGWVEVLIRRWSSMARPLWVTVVVRLGLSALAVCHYVLDRFSSYYGNSQAEYY